MIEILYCCLGFTTDKVLFCYVNVFVIGSSKMSLYFWFDFVIFVSKLVNGMVKYSLCIICLMNSVVFLLLNLHLYEIFSLITNWQLLIFLCSGRCAFWTRFHRAMCSAIYIIVWLLMYLYDYIKVYNILNQWNILYAIFWSVQKRKLINSPMNWKSRHKILYWTRLWLQFACKYYLLVRTQRLPWTFIAYRNIQIVVKKWLI